MKIKNKSFKDKSKKWLKRHVDDEFVQKSISDNYRSRAAYKLVEIIEKYKILDEVKNVIDLGSAPGSWCQVLKNYGKGLNSIIAVDILKMAEIKGVGIEFAFEVSSLIFGGAENWNSDENLSNAAKKVGLDLIQLRESVTVHEDKIIEQIKQNQVDQLNAGHHGVPLTVIGDKYFFGQDQFEKIMETLKENGLKER